MTVEEQVKQLPRDQKLRLMEVLWTDLSHDEGRFESPLWHEKELQATEQRVASGEEQSVDWERAKQQIRDN